MSRAQDTVIAVKVNSERKLRIANVNPKYALKIRPTTRHASAEGPRGFQPARMLLFILYDSTASAPQPVFALSSSSRLSLLRRRRLPPLLLLASRRCHHRPDVPTPFRYPLPQSSVSTPTMPTRSKRLTAPTTRGPTTSSAGALAPLTGAVVPRAEPVAGAPRARPAA